MKTSLRSFTMVEVIIALSLFTVVIISVIMVTTKAYTFVQLTKMQTIAVNLAREGMEMVYNIRDTNRRRFSGDKDKFWLKADTFDDSSEEVVYEGLYRLKQVPQVSQSSYVFDGQSYFALERYTGTSDIDEIYENFLDYVESDGEFFQIPFTGGLYSGNDLVHSAEELMEREASFFRVVNVMGVYDKLAGTPDVKLNCSTADSCDTVSPKELRFCIRIYYLFTSFGYTELCGMLTNFEK